MIWRSFLMATLVVAAAGAQTAPQPRTEERDRVIRYDGTPLLKAKLALEDARGCVAEDRYQDAAAALRNASHALVDYQSEERGPHAETADYIHQQIDSYLEKLERVHNREDAIDRINFWLGPINRWYEGSLKHRPR
jgi:hypothetical protein